VVHLVTGGGRKSWRNGLVVDHQIEPSTLLLEIFYGVLWYRATDEPSSTHDRDHEAHSTANVLHSESWNTVKRLPCLECHLEEETGSFLCLQGAIKCHRMPKESLSPAEALLRGVFIGFIVSQCTV